MTDTMQELKDQALSEIQQEVNSEGLCRSGAEDRVFEIADSNVPIYYADIADYLPEVGHDMPELAEGATTVYQLIQIAIMEEIEHHLYNWIREADECTSCECLLTTAEDEHPDCLCQNCAVSETVV